MAVSRSDVGDSCCLLASPHGQIDETLLPLLIVEWQVGSCVEYSYQIGTRETIFETAGESNIYVHFNILNALRYNKYNYTKDIFSNKRQ